jgi:hypothetical protein
MERLAQYIIRNPFSVEKMRATEPRPASASGSILYRFGMNKKIGRNFEVFTLATLSPRSPSTFPARAAITASRCSALTVGHAGRVINNAPLMAYPPYSW